MDLIIFASDFHFGRKTSGWNFKRAQSTLATLSKQACQIASENSVGRIFVLFLGDIMDGESVYPEQNYELELLGFEQVYEGAHLFAGHFIAPLTAVAPVHLDGVAGNHAYLRFAHRKTNLDYFFYAELENKLREMKVRVTSSFWHRKADDALEVKVVNCGSAGVLIGHGHFLRGVVETPFAGAQRRVMSWLISRRLSFEIAAFGHFHRFAFYSVPGGKFVLFNGCMLAHDEFSLTRFGHHGDRLWAALLVQRKRILEMFFLRDEKLEKGHPMKVTASARAKSHDREHKRPPQGL